MPHDSKSQRLRPGDIVTVRAIVTGVDAHEDGINVALETVIPLYPGTMRTSLLLNTRQVELVERLGQTDPNMDVTAAIEHKASESGTIPVHK